MAEIPATEAIGAITTTAGVDANPLAIVGAEIGYLVEVDRSGAKLKQRFRLTTVLLVQVFIRKMLAKSAFTDIIAFTFSDNCA